MSARNLIKSYLRRATRDSLLGVGCYSAVMRANNSRNQVIKIGTEACDPWLDYYYEVIKGMNTPHTPKVHRLYTDSAKKYYVALIEELTPLDDVNREFVESVRQYTKSDNSYSELKAEAEQMPSIPCAEHFIAFIDYLLERTSVVSRWEAEDCDEDARTLDIHNGNWMLRGDGTLVLIDPWAHYEIEADLKHWADYNVYNKYGYAA
jgi:hypothetical protein